ncbi:MAG: hypothetical protein OEZ06_28275 [Myxococcales bacterium]|nr:hypothetical protein [Myxococcales bacterium]
MNFADQIRSILPSLLVLSGVFYFINAACFRNNDEADSFAPSFVCSSPGSKMAPGGAQLSFVEPRDGSEISGALLDGAVIVPVRFAVAGVMLTASAECLPGSGAVALVAAPEDPGCGRLLQTRFTAAEANIGLVPGDYRLTAKLVDQDGFAFTPEVTASTRVRVRDSGSDGQVAADAGVPPCAL